MGTRRRDLFKSQAEIKADTLRRVTDKGYANFTQAAIILGWSHIRVRSDVNTGDIRAFQLGERRYIPLEELERLRGQDGN